MFKQTQPTFSYSDFSGAKEQLAYIFLITALHSLKELQYPSSVISFPDKVMQTPLAF